VDALARVLFLLEHEHVVVEELLQLLVDEVDPQLLEAVELKRSAKKRVICRNCLFSLIIGASFNSKSLI